MNFELKSMILFTLENKKAFFYFLTGASLNTLIDL